MIEENFQLRTYAFIDSMQPQYAAFLAAELDGDVPLARMAVSDEVKSITR